MTKFNRLFIFVLIGCSLAAQAQTKRETDWGGVLGLAGEKDLARDLTLSVDEEIRFIENNNYGFHRSATTVGLDYAFLRKKLKVGGYYSFLYLYNKDYFYEPRHRYYLNISYKETFEPFVLSWRGRLQGTYRDENRGEYKINPKYVMKNKFEIAYMIWGSPWKPFLACDLSTALNDPVNGYELLRIRYEGGTSWRLNRTEYLEFFLRFDNYLSGRDANVLSAGVAFKKKF